MFNKNAVTRMQASTVWVAIASLVLAVMLPLFALQPNVDAAVLTSRSVTIESSEAGLADNQYVISFDVATSSSTAGMVVAFCDSPLIGTACNAPAGLDTNEATITLSDAGSTTPLTTLAVNAATDVNWLVIGYDANTPGVGDTITVNLGTGAATDGIDNPSGAGAFYARFLTYDTVANAANWVSGTPGTHIDDGGVALSTADQIDITARVQEQLNFCVGTTISADDCGTVSGTSVDLGVLSNASIVEASDGGLIGPTFNTQITTNAQSGVSLTYIGDNLAVGGASCADINTDRFDTPLTSDYCINRDSDPDSNGVMVAGTEQWGINEESHSNASTNPETTGALAPTAAYDTTSALDFAFVPNAATEMANSSGVVDSETIEWNVGATINLTTPSGLYQTTLTFVATGVF